MIIMDNNGGTRVRMFGVVGVHDAGTTRPSMYVADGGACDWRVVSVGVWRAVKPVDWTGLDYLSGVMRRRATRTRE